MVDEERWDDMFFGILRAEGNGAEGILDMVMGFLKRRTDFFYFRDEELGMGFEPGKAEQIVMLLFAKYRA